MLRFWEWSGFRMLGMWVIVVGCWVGGIGCWQSRLISHTLFPTFSDESPWEPRETSLPDPPVASDRFLNSPGLAALGFGVVLAVLVYWYIQRRVWKPLRIIRGALSRGETVSPPVSASTPVREVAEALRYYQTSMEETIRSLRQAMQQLHLTLQTAQDAYVRLDPEGLVQDVNPSFERLFQKTREELVGRPFAAFFSSESQAFLAERLKVWRQGPDVVQRPVQMATGEVLYLMFSASPMIQDDRLVGIVLFVHDLTTLHRFEVELTRMSTTDPLTGLMNRRVFMESLEMYMRRAWQERRRFSVVFINIDYFKLIVSQYGTLVGDTILRTLPALISWPQHAMVARCGDDEFVALLVDVPVAEAQAWAERVRTQIERTSFPVASHAVRITVTCAVVGFPEHGRTLTELVSNGYWTLNQAKQMGGNRVVVPQWDQSPQLGRTALMDKPRRLLEAKDEGRLLPYYQPIIELTTRQVFGFEVLARIVGDEGDIIPAQEFLDVMAALPPTDQVEVDRYLYHRALEELQGVTGVFRFFNLSPAFLVTPARFDDVCREIMERGIPPHTVVFEISERVVLRDIQALQRMIEIARAYGFRFALDDFGSGFSSFQYFRVLSVDFLKVDGSYIVGLHQSLDNRCFLEAFVHLAQHFSIEIIAEHVQVEEDLEVLQSMGIRLGQGFLFGHPADRTRLEQWLSP